MRRWVARAREMGAPDAKIVGPAGVLTAAWVRLKCQYGCDGYGQRLTCPPFSPTAGETRAVLDEYRHLLLVHGGPWRSVTKIVTRIEREAFLEGHYKAFAWGAGPCTLCRACDTSGACTHADRARPSMEAAGIDVYATARAAGMPIEVVRARGERGDYYGLVALE